MSVTSANEQDIKDDKSKATQAATPEDTIKALEQALKVAEQAVADSKNAQNEAEKKAEDARLRGLAEIENMRRRTQLDIVNARNYSIEGLSRELLLVIDSLEQALMVESSDDALKHGIQLTLKLLLDSLDKFGIQQIDPLGQAFNPAQHEAIAMQPTENSKEANTVLVVAQKGFTLKDRILRPARVVVASATASPTVQMAEATLGEKNNIDDELV
jgi:molecular chaperone GrpE